MTVVASTRSLKWLILRMEIRRFCSSTKSLAFIPLTFLAIAASFSPQLPTPFIPVFGVVFAGLESQYNNILFRTPNEFQAFSLFPVKWKPVVLAKNLAAVLITLLVCCAVAIPTLYFSPVVVTPHDVTQALLYLLTVVFPLLHAGNLRSVQHPRPEAGLGTDDIAECGVTVVIAGIASIPYLVIIALPYSSLLCLMYAAVLSAYWFGVSVPATAATIGKGQQRLCQAS